MTMTNRTLEVERSTSTAHRLTHYDGVCGNVHGHNFDWVVEVDVAMDPQDESAMPLDLKEVADAIDEVDHATLLNENDPLLEQGDAVKAALGRYITFDRDPTCEVVAKWMGGLIYRLDDAVEHVRITVHETDKYGISTEYGRVDESTEPVSEKL